MKSFNKVVLHILFWIAIPLLILYFKWAAQDTTALPGLPASVTESFFEIIRSNIDVIVISLLGSIPIFYCSRLCLSPKLLFPTNALKIVLFAAAIVVYYFMVRLISVLIFPMYNFFGTPYAVKVLLPIVLISALVGALFAFKQKLNH